METPQKAPQQMPRKIALAIETYGWISVFCILLAHFLVSWPLIAGGSLIHNSLNAFGALGIVLSSAAKKDYQPVALNAVWLFIAVFSICKNL